jgi:hypothetical protein
MKTICLDLSTHRTGVAFFDDDKFIKHFSITPSEKLAPLRKVKFIVDELRPHFVGKDECVIEDIFLGVFNGFNQVVGFALLARLSGAVINEWMNLHDSIPTLYKATEARKLAGIKGTVQKAEVQVFVAEKFGFASEEQLHVFKSMIEGEYAGLQEQEFTKATWKKHMGQISAYIEGEIELGEDSADAVLLGLAINNARKNET